MGEVRPPSLFLRVPCFSNIGWKLGTHAHCLLQPYSRIATECGVSIRHRTVSKQVSYHTCCPEVEPNMPSVSSRYRVLSGKGLRASLSAPFSSGILRGLLYSRDSFIHSIQHLMRITPVILFGFKAHFQIQEVWWNAWKDFIESTVIAFFPWPLFTSRLVLQ